VNGRLKPWLIRAGLCCGVLAPVLWAATIVLAGELRPGFDHASQYISELGERGSRTEVFMRYGSFVPTGLMHAAFAAAFGALLVRRGNDVVITALVTLLIALDGFGRVGAGLFSCEPGCASPEVFSQRVHNLTATVAFFSIIIATLLAPRVFRHHARLRPLKAYSFLSGCAAIIFLVLMRTSEATGVATGTYERLATGVLSLWVLVVAVRLWPLVEPTRPPRPG